MKDFIKEYVKGYLACLGVDIEKYESQIDKVIKYVCADDHWTDALDYSILASCDRFEVPVKTD